jgi:RHS repeat-associated protein
VSNWDDFNRLINDVTYPWSGTGVNYEYAYDRYGNRWNQTLNQLCNQGVSVCIKFDQYNHVTGGPLSYDAAGNVINDGNHTYTYDAANHLTGVGGGGTTASYAYDGSGQRVAKTVNGTTVQDLYDLSGHVVTEENAAGQWNRGEVYAGGQHLATYRSDKTYFSAVDALGTERMSATVDQTSNESCMNLPFGDDLTCTGTAVGEVSPLHFTGKERDGESGLDYFIHRHYASTMGRFMQPDPAGMMAVDIGSPQTLNRYTYVLNNPLSLVDPFGLDCAYLNSSGTGVAKGGIDQNSSSGECGKTGGYWVEGSVTNVTIGGDAETVSLTGTTNGNTNNTSASYQQNATFDVGEFHNTMFNPYNHIALGLHGGTLFGQNPRSDSQFVRAISVHGLKAVVPGAIKPQVGGQLLNMVHIPVTGMQAQMMQDAINQSAQNPPPYSVEGGGARVCDCASWAQQILGDAGINSGPSTPWPDTLIQQLNQQQPPQQ